METKENERTSFSRSDLRRVLPHADLSELSGYSNKWGTFLRCWSDVRLPEPLWRLALVDGCDPPTEPVRNVPDEFRMLQEARSPFPTRNNGLGVAAAAFELCSGLHRQAYRERRTPFWYTYDVEYAGVRVHVRGGLGTDPSWRTRNAFGPPGGTVSLVAFADCNSPAWPVGGVDPQAGSPIPLTWHTTVHMLELTEVDREKDPPDPLR